MSKIICDVCGTTYPDSVSQCPICGCVRSADAHVVSSKQDGDALAGAGGTYSHVKGGRFSKSNVKKRQKGRPQEFVESENDLQENESKKVDRGLIIAFIVLLLSVAAVVCYILVKFLSPDSLNPNAGKKPVIEGGNNADVVADEEEMGYDDEMGFEEEDSTCLGISFEQSSATLSQTGATFQIVVALTPADTTDVLSFASSNDNVATVTEEGLVTAVGNGEAVITVTCGEIEETFNVVCSIETATPELPSTSDVDLPSVPAGFTLKKEDITFATKGQSYTLYDGNLKNDITWTSSNPKVATVSKGKVTAVSKGTVTITAEYQGAKLKCIVRCKDSVGEYVDPDSPQAQYKLNKTDVTISVNESFVLSLLDENGERVNVTFSSSNSNICTVSGNSVVGVAQGTANVTVTYEGTTYSCIVRVVDPPDAGQ